MRELFFDDESLNSKIINELSDNAVLIEFPYVYGLIAKPNHEGIHLLNKIKNRKPNKFYSSAIGDLEHFCNLISKDLKLIRSKNFIKGLNDIILRVRITKTPFNSSVVCNGTHQGLISDSEHRSLFKFIENYFKNSFSEDLFNGKKYTAPFCTSANLSGDPNGSITSLKNAREFGKQRGINIMIRMRESKKSILNKGSYPILQIENNKIQIVRDGYLNDHIRNKIQHTTT